MAASAGRTAGDSAWVRDRPSRINDPHGGLPQPEAVRLPDKARFATELAAWDKARRQANAEQIGEGPTVRVTDSAGLVDQRQLGDTSAQHDLLPVRVEHGQGSRPISQSRHNEIRTPEQSVTLILIAVANAVKDDAVFRRPPPDLPDAHQQITRFQPEPGQPEHKAAHRADVGRAEFVIAVCKRRLDRGIEHAKRAPVQNRDAAGRSRRIGKFAQQQRRCRESARAAAHDDDLRLGHRRKPLLNQSHALRPQNLVREDQLVRIVGNERPPRDRLPFQTLEALVAAGREQEGVARDLDRRAVHPSSKADAPRLVFGLRGPKRLMSVENLAA